MRAPCSCWTTTFLRPMLKRGQDTGLETRHAKHNHHSDRLQKTTSSLGCAYERHCPNGSLHAQQGRAAALQSARQMCAVALEAHASASVTAQALAQSAAVPKGRRALEASGVTRAAATLRAQMRPTEDVACLGSAVLVSDVRTRLSRNEGPHTDCLRRCRRHIHNLRPTFLVAAPTTAVLDRRNHRPHHDVCSGLCDADALVIGSTAYLQNRLLLVPRQSWRRLL